ncbi:MAG TPA: hypothetical protein DDZ88_11055 [Verrucomicrobiales bacterium]|nr:hypothetical protein [Verrucomicrobiales bacterium]
MSPAVPTRPSARLAQRGIVLLVCLSLGLHWAVIQGIAWTGMLISYAAEGAMIEAVQKTFDGQHGCPLCQTVKEGRESDQNQPRQTGQAMKKLDAVLAEMVRLTAPPAEMLTFVMIHEDWVKRTEMPETPPPRRGLV